MGCKGSKVRILSLRPNYRSVSSIKSCHRRAFLLSKNRLCATSLRSLMPFSFTEGAVGPLATSLPPVHGSSFRADPRARSMHRHALRFVPPACPSLPNGWPAARGRKSSCRRRPLDCNGSACGDCACLQRDEKTSLSQPRTACRPFWGFVHGDTPRGAKPCRHPTGSLRAGPGLVRRLLRARSPASGAVALHSLRVVQDGLRLVRMRFRIAARVWRQAAGGAGMQVGRWRCDKGCLWRLAPGAGRGLCLVDRKRRTARPMPSWRDVHGRPCGTAHRDCAASDLYGLPRAEQGKT